MQIARSCLAYVTPFHFWSLADHFPDLVSRLHVQVRLMGQFGLSGGIPWLRDSDGAFCFVCKQDVESVTHFLVDCSFISLWRNLKLKITVSNQGDRVNICQFIDNLDPHHMAFRGPLFTIRQCNKYVDRDLKETDAAAGHIQISIQLRVNNVRGRLNSLGLESFLIEICLFTASSRPPRQFASDQEIYSGSCRKNS